MELEKRILYCMAISTLAVIIATILPLTFRSIIGFGSID